jgi:hypothetical protein
MTEGFLCDLSSDYRTLGDGWGLVGLGELAAADRCWSNQAQIARQNEQAWLQHGTANCCLVNARTPKLLALRISMASSNITVQLRITPATSVEEIVYVDLCALKRRTDNLGTH